MSRSRHVAVLDACVLIPMPVVDTLLRIAEEPAFYSPRWSADILNEVSKTLSGKWKYSEAACRRRIETMQLAFPEAMVVSYEDLTGAMKNEPKDRHVLAAAVRCGADTIVSDNKKHFPRKALEPYRLECVTADEFLAH